MRTLRLTFPQWQGGNMTEYVMGARLLNWISPKSSNVVECEVPILEPDGKELEEEDGVLGRTAIKQQFLSAASIIESISPDRIITFGGDCHVSQAPFAYLNEKYKSKVGILWLDTHPDISNLDMFNQENAMVLGNLMGEGDPDFSQYVKCPFASDMVLYGGIIEHTMTDEEKTIVTKKHVSIIPPEELKRSTKQVCQWIKDKKIEYLAVHFDLDVTSPSLFRGQLTAKPGGSPIETPEGTLTLDIVQRIINDVAKETDLVGLTISEHIPWDVINLQNFMKGIHIFQ